MIAVIACINQANSIGRKNDLLYRNKEDMKKFVELTKHYTYLVMGRKTFDSLYEIPQDDRILYVLTEDTHGELEQKIVKEFPNVTFIDEEMLGWLVEQASNTAIDLAVIGGTSIYNLFLSKLDVVSKIHLTVVHDDLIGDSFFPFIDDKKYTFVESPDSERSKRRQEANSELYRTEYRVYQRKRVEN